MTAIIHNVPPLQGGFQISSENVNTGMQVSNNHGERVHGALALVLHDDGTRADAAVATAVDDPSLAAAIHRTTAGDARDTVDAWDGRAIRASSGRRTQEWVRDGAAAT